MPEERAASQRRRRAKVTQLGRGYEYMDLGTEPAPPDSGAGAPGFAGTAARDGAGTAAGLTTLATRLPMMPGTWEADPD
ncbi:hypothetical protein H7I01_18720 [Mycobacterium palustre]|nr:hypothetical protein [Mycobacterium palustre]